MRGGRFSIALCACLLLGAIAAVPAGATGFLDEWGSSGSGPGEFGFPVSVATDDTGNVYVADSDRDRIEKFDESGRFLDEWGGSGSLPGDFATPESVATDAFGDVYVVDLGNSRVEKFDPNGAFLAQWGSEGSGPGQLKTPEGIAVDGAGNVYVADAVNDRIEKYSSSGAFLAEWGSRGTGRGQFDYPDSVATDSAGDVYVADSENDRVQKFSGSGAFIAKWGSSGAGPGKFGFPVAVATDQAGHVYVADSGDDRVEKFSAKGKFLTQWGDSGSGPGQFSSPLAIAAGAGGRIFVADSGNDRIETFGTLPAPEYGKTVNVGPVSGVVKVRLPGKKKSFVLDTELQVPVGAILDTTSGRMRLTSAKDADTSQSADFFNGEFRVLQPKGGKPITVLKLITPLHCGSKPKRSSIAARSHGNGLWGSGHGNFRSVGKHGSATVRGTIWWSQDRCDGTLFRVKRGVVTIRDFTRHRTLKIRAGMRYLAPAA